MVNQSVNSYLNGIMYNYKYFQISDISGLFLVKCVQLMAEHVIQQFTPLNNQSFPVASSGSNSNSIVPYSNTSEIGII